MTTLSITSILIILTHILVITTLIMAYIAIKKNLDKLEILILPIFFLTVVLCFIQISYRIEKTQITIDNINKQLQEITLKAEQ
jgi:hypothetical protein